MSNDENRPADKAPRDLRKASEDLRARITEAQRRNDMPIDSALGNPAWEQHAADGHLDRREEEDEA